MKVKNQKTGPKDREGKKRPFQDDTALIVAVAIILITAQIYYVALMKELAKPKKVVIRVEGDDVARAINQDLAGQRNNIEAHIKNFLAIPQREADDARMAHHKPFFNAQGWQGYQEYVATMQKTLGAGQSLRAEFVFGSQKYATLSGDLTIFRADGLFCLGQDAGLKCGPQGFSMQVVMRGNLNKLDGLQFEDWKVLPPRTAPAR